MRKTNSHLLHLSAPVLFKRFQSELVVVLNEYKEEKIQDVYLKRDQRGRCFG